MDSVVSQDSFQGVPEQKSKGVEEGFPTQTQAKLFRPHVGVEYKSDVDVVLSTMVASLGAAV
eukprot:4446803-Amphidinium_carterae.1